MNSYMYTRENYLTYVGTLIFTNNNNNKLKKSYN